MRLALHAEWTKLRTVAGPVWLLLATIALTVALGGLTVGATTYATAGAGVDLTRLGLTGVQLGQAVVAVLAVLVVAGEYGTGMIRTTLSAVPHRWTLLGAKAAVVTAAVLAAGTVAVLGSLLVARLVLPGNGYTAAHGVPPPSLADGPTLRAAAGSVLYLALVALLALGVAAMLRDAAAAVGAVLALLYLLPVLLTVVSDPDWERRIRQLGPMAAGLAVQVTRDVDGLPIGPWKGLGVLACWAAGALLLGGLVLHRRDA